MDALLADASARWRRTLGIVFGLGTQVLFLATVWELFWFLRDGASTNRRGSLWLDAVLALQFVVPHSLLLMPRVRSKITRHLPSELYGCLFCAATCVGLWIVFLGWQTRTPILWQATGTGARVVQLAFYASWLGLLYSLNVSGFGYQTGWTPWRYWYRCQRQPRRDLITSGPYRRLRHPAYLSFLGLVWFTPRMTVDHALLTGIWTAYIFVGSYLKDQRLAFFLGDTYWDYAERVPGYPLMFIGPLGRRKRPVATPAGAPLRRAA